MKNQEIFVHNRAKFAELYRRTGEVHNLILLANKSAQGHGRDHDLVVAQYCAIIAEHPRVGEMAWCAALMHSFDRLFTEETEATQLVEECLTLVRPVFMSVELDEIRAAVANHSGKNSSSDNSTLVTLKDADKLANCQALVLVRGGQHRPTIPACILEYLGTQHPDTTFRNPKSCYDALWGNLEWEAMLCLPKAKEIGRQKFAFLREFMARVEEDFRETGLHPWPK